MSSDLAPSFLDCGWAGAAIEGDESGDRHVVVGRPYGALLAVIDGLGHGPEAAAAALQAVRTLQARPELSIEQLFETCHQALRPTRGVVMTLAVLNHPAAMLEWCGVGNVEAVLFRDASSANRRDALTLRGGVVGYRLPTIRVSTLPLGAGDVLVFATDGVRNDFGDDVDRDGDAQQIADSIWTRSVKGSDDSLVFVARYLGGSP